jgi:hypothetical protein
MFDLFELNLHNKDSSSHSRTHGDKEFIASIRQYVRNKRIVRDKLLYPANTSRFMKTLL